MNRKYKRQMDAEKYRKSLARNGMGIKKLKKIGQIYWSLWNVELFTLPIFIRDVPPEKNDERKERSNGKEEKQTKNIERREKSCLDQPLI